MLPEPIEAVGALPVLPNKHRPLRARGLGARWRVPMIHLLFTALLCALASSQVTAQNWVSQTLLGLDEDQRNETFTYLLRDSNAKCDRVIRTLFNGSRVELDDWEVLCRERNSYSLAITPEQS